MQTYKIKEGYKQPVRKILGAQPRKRKTQRGQWLSQGYSTRRLSAAQTCDGGGVTSRRSVLSPFANLLF